MPNYMNSSIKPVEIKIRPVETEAEADKCGAFQYQPNHFTTPFGDGEGELKAEKGCCHLYWAKGCHWSNHASIVRELLGLGDVTSVTIIGRDYEDPEEHRYGRDLTAYENQVDPTTGAEFLSEPYYRANPDYTGRTTAPALVNLETYTIVNNDYHRLTSYLEANFKPFQKVSAPNLYPEKLRADIDNLSDNVLLPLVNNGVYRVMFAQFLAAYEEVFDDFFTALDVLEKRLENNRFLFDDHITDSDARFFITLARFDTHCYRNLGPIKKRTSEYTNIQGYTHDLYEAPTSKRNTYSHGITRGWDAKREKLFADFNSRFVDDIGSNVIWSAP